MPTDPFAPPLGANPGYPSAAVSMGSSAGPYTIPYPTINVAGSAPPQLQWVVIANVSPQAVLVGGQMVLGVLPPFTQDKYLVSPLAGQSPIVCTVLVPFEFVPDTPVPGGFTGGSNQSLGNLFAIWYENEPIGAFPTGVGNNRTSGQTLAIRNVTSPTVGTQTIPLGVETWMQTVAFRAVKQGGAGTLTGWQVTLTDQSANPTIDYQTTLDDGGQWGYFPINSDINGKLLQFAPILNSVLGGSFVGFIEVVGLAGPITQAQLGVGSPQDYGVAARMGLQAEVTILAGATTTILGEPATGTMYHIRGVSVTYTVAPAAPQGIVLRGTNGAPAGLAYWRGICPTAIGNSANSGPTSFLVGGATSRADPAEGLQGVNNANQNGIFLLNYDIIPYQLGPGLSE